jgi:cysteine desulfurase
VTARGRQRVYLDWNATAPLRPEARAAMLAAMDAVGNPSSVHAEGRAARAIVERARGQVAALVGCEPGEVVFTSGATEAIDLALGDSPTVAWPCDHDSVLAHASADITRLGCSGQAEIPHHRPDLPHAGRPPGFEGFGSAALSYASGETGVVQPFHDFLGFTVSMFPPFFSLCDISQAVGRIPLGIYDNKVCLGESGLDYAVCSAHKIGGPKGVGALCLLCEVEPARALRGGGQESGRRAGTENVVGIAGFGAAAEAARRDLEAGVWARVARLRDQLEARLESAAPDLIIMGRGASRLPNTSCFALPGWPGETQVMQMDLAGFAVSAGSACSSGKVERASRVLLAMGFDERTASSSLRVSLGPTTTEAEVMAFAEAWIDCCRRRNSRAA